MNVFSLWVGIGAGLGLWRVWRSAPRRQAGFWVNVGLWVLLASLVGARLFYTLLNRAYFSNHLIEIPQIWLGGLSWPGAVGAAWLALLYFAAACRMPLGGRMTFGWLCDRLYPLLPPLSVTAWLGCWAAGIAYGPPAPAGAWWGVPSLDSSGVYTPHWPLQALAALSLLVFFWLLETLARPRRPGWLSGLAAGGLLLHLLATSLLRSDPAPTWAGGLRVDAWMALFFLGCLAGMATIGSLAGRIWSRPSVTNPVDPL